MSTGKTVQIIGAVVDVEFPRESIPQIYDALKIDDAGLTLEVQQQLGDGIVRTIAMGSSEGLKRGMTVTNTGGPITVPVGTATLVSGGSGDILQLTSNANSHGAFITARETDEVLDGVRQAAADLVAFGQAFELVDIP